MYLNNRLYGEYLINLGDNSVVSFSLLPPCCGLCCFLEI